MDTELKDICGTPFKVGDKVATDTMAYRSSALRIGVVTEVQDLRGYPNVKVSYEIYGRKQSVWRRPESVVKVAA